MKQPRLNYVMCANPSGTHRMAYWEWGDPDSDHVVLCVHGLTRTGRDFDYLAQHLPDSWRIVCPDIAGRGKSDWLSNPAYYQVPQYIADILTLIARLNTDTVSWLGTSMGGLIGLGLTGALALSAAQRPQRGATGLPPGSTVRFDKMILNDIGPNLELTGIQRIADYVGQEVRFDTFEEATAYVQAVSPGFGRHTDAQWAELTRHVFNQIDGVWTKHYDPGIAQPMQAETDASLAASETLLWAAWQSLQIPVLVLRGAQSDLLSQDTVRIMTERNPRTRSTEFPDVGHAPTLMSPEQIKPVIAFLQEEPTTLMMT